MKTSRRDLVRALGVLYVGFVVYSLTNYKSRSIVSMPEHIVDPRLDVGGKCKVRLSGLHLVDGLDVRADVDLAALHASMPSVRAGGAWRPSGCEAWQRIAVVIPYRDRFAHLKLVLRRLHELLQAQRAAYQIFVVEQAGKEDFNRGRLLNIGFAEALKRGGQFDCFVFHDVDLLPESDKNLYYCDEHARHLSPAIDEMRYHVMYYNAFGGVTAISRANFELVNGYPNRYAGWGNEDDDMSARTSEAGLLLSRPPNHIGRYKMVRHMKSARSKHGYDHFMRWRHWWKIDGIKSLDRTGYQVLELTMEPLYTNVTVDIGDIPSPSPEDIPQESTLWFLWWFFP